MEVNLGRTYMDLEYAVQNQARVQNTESTKGENQPVEQIKDEQNGRVNTQDLQKATEDMSKWVQALNADIQFKIHDGTGELMVQVVDTTDQKVLREFPPHEFLDTVAKIREYVGMLLDKKI